MGVRAAIGILLVGGLLLCPLASTGVFLHCHEGEAAMDCCKPGAGSAAPASLMVSAPLVAAAVVPLLTAAAPNVAPMASPPCPWGLRPADDICIRLSTLLI